MFVKLLLPILGWQNSEKWLLESYGKKEWSEVSRRYFEKENYKWFTALLRIIWHTYSKLGFEVTVGTKRCCSESFGLETAITTLKVLL